MSSKRTDEPPAALPSITEVKDLFGLMLEAAHADHDAGEQSDDAPAKQAKAAFEAAAPDVRAAVEKLLAAHRRASGVLLDGAEASDAQDAAAAQTSIPVPSIPGYEISEVIGHGGFGVVYRAMQRHPVERAVAVKVLRAELASAEVISRFRAEARILARMNHPGIARVLDAGLDDRRRPFVTMELVQGVSLLKYCQQHGLALRDRVQIMIDVCAAVHHAHQRGVVHRDLKPANILVEHVDGRHQPHVIDFGIARSIDSDGQMTLLTEIGQLIGTMAYMSPEQFAGDPDRIGTLSDIYSLGVLSYELFTGRLPIDVIGKSLPEAASMVMKLDVPRLSTINRMLRGDLESILDKALQKEPELRYASAAEMAADLQRYLDDQPVLARRPSAIYQLRKYARRNKPVVIAALGVLAAVFIGLLGTSYGLHRALEAQAAERQARQVAERREQELQSVADFQSMMIARINAQQMGIGIASDLRHQIEAALRQAGIEQNVLEERLDWYDQLIAGVNMTNIAVHAIDQNMLAQALKAIDVELADQPTVQAALLKRVADTYERIGRVETAVELTERAMNLLRQNLGAREPETLLAQFAHSNALLMAGRLDEARDLLEQTIPDIKQAFGPDHREVYAGLTLLGKVLEARGMRQEAAELFMQVAEGNRRHLGDDHPHTLAALNNVGFILRQLGRDDEALPYLERVLEARRRRGDPHDSNSLMTLVNVAAIAQAAGRMDDAEAYNREALEGFRRMYGDESSMTLTVMNNLATVLASQGKFDEAKQWGRMALQGRQATLGDDHPDTIQSHFNHAALLMRLNEYSEAEAYVQYALDGYERTLGASHPRRLIALRAYGVILHRTGRLAQAEQVLQNGLEATRERLGESHTYFAQYLRDLGRLRIDLGQFEQAERDLLQSLELSEQRMPLNRSHVVASLQAIVELYERWHQSEPDAKHDQSAATYAARLQQMQD